MADTDAKQTCGYCDNYVIMGTELRGICRAIPGEKPGQRGKKVTYDMDASQCPKFQPLGDIRSIDIAQGSGLDSVLGGRASTVFETTIKDTKTDRLVWEKHAKEKE